MSYLITVSLNRNSQFTGPLPWVLTAYFYLYIRLPGMTIGCHMNARNVGARHRGQNHVLPDAAGVDIPFLFAVGYVLGVKWRPFGFRFALAVRPSRYYNAVLRGVIYPHRNLIAARLHIGPDRQIERCVPALVLSNKLAVDEYLAPVIDRTEVQQ